MNYQNPEDSGISEYYNPGYLNVSGDWLNPCIYAGITDKTIIDEWNMVMAPPAPELISVSVDPKTSALLILDMESTICNTHRCLSSVCNIYRLLTNARENGMLVVYSITNTGNPTDIIWQLAPLPDEPIVKSNVDKFYHTYLENILQDHGIKTVLVTGYAANGAVLHTATSAAFRGYNVIVPVDCMSASIPYAEQYTAWHMLNSPGTRNHTALTKTSLISFS